MLSDESPSVASLVTMKKECATRPAEISVTSGIEEADYGLTLGLPCCRRHPVQQPLRVVRTGRAQHQVPIPMQAPSLQSSGVQHPHLPLQLPLLRGQLQAQGMMPAARSALARPLMVS